MPDEIDVTAPATDLARQWQGWGTALKPAHEPIVMARKPLVGTVAQNVTRYGTGALNIDGSRIPGAEPYVYPTGPRGNTFTVGAGPDGTRQEPVESNAAGRWPSNVLLSDPELFDQPNPYVVGSGATSDSGQPHQVRRRATSLYEGGWASTDEGFAMGGSGGYSRFFIVPKADRAEREPVLRPNGHDKATRFTTHPTVKPVDLMRHLVRLVTPPGGTVLDPFLGSGTTAIACELEGFPWIGIEKEPEYVAIAEARLNGTQRGLGLDVPAPTRKRTPAKDNPDLSRFDGVTRWIDWKENSVKKDSEDAA